MNSAPSDNKYPFSKLLALAAPYWKLLLIGIFLMLLGIAMTLVYPQLFRIIIDEAFTTQNVTTLNVTTVLLLGSFFVYALSNALRFWIFGVVGEQIVAALKKRLFSHLMRQDIAYFDEQQSGDLLSRLSVDTQSLQNTLSQELALWIRYGFTALGGLILLFLISMELTVILLLIVPPTIWFTARAGNVIRRFSSQTQTALAQSNQVASESFSGIRTIRAFATESKEMENYNKAVNSALSFVKSRVFSIATMEGCVVFTSSAAVVAVMWFGSKYVISGDITVGQLTSYLLYTYLVTSSVSGLANLWAEFSKSMGALERVFLMFDSPISNIHDGSVTLPNIRGNIEFKGVQFRYRSRPDLPILSGFNLKISEGECVALVGPSGAGKSTLAGLLWRFYEPDSGTITVDGRDIRELDITWFRQQVAMVDQQPMMFATSIAENIAYGHPEATTEEIKHAATLANVHDFIESLSDGYDTMVGDNGVQLSGGQKQRIVVARALLTQPQILLLDEATSALDSENERLLTDALQTLMKGRTSIIIAHRLSMVANADRVIVLNGGQIVQQGTHQELIKDKTGLYFSLAQQQDLSS